MAASAREFPHASFQIKEINAVMLERLRDPKPPRAISKNLNGA